MIRYTPQFSAVCSVGNAPFHGVIEIQCKPADKLLEFESFERWLSQLALERLTIEDLARLVFDALLHVLGDVVLSVTVHAETTVHAPVSATVVNESE